MLTKNILALVKIVSSASDPKSFVEAIFIVLFQSWVSSVWMVRNVPYKEAYFSPTLIIHHWGYGTQCLTPWYFLCNKAKCPVGNMQRVRAQGFCNSKFRSNKKM